MHKPFTLPHFRDWAADLILDNGESFHPEPFQEAFLEDVFGGCPECWLVLPEGNGKTTLIATLALYHCEFHPNANVPVAASSREQTGIMYRQAEGFVLRSPRLYEPVHSAIQQAKGKLKVEVPRFTCLEGYRRLNHFEGGRIQIFAADAGTGDGVIPSLAIIDELHRHKDLALYRTWSGKLTKRKGQLVAISTAGEPFSDFEVTREKIRQSGKVTHAPGFTRSVTPRVTLHDWAVTETGDVENFELVKQANPFSGVTVTGLGEKFASDTMTLSYWRRFVCNLPTRNDSAAITEIEWHRAKSTEQIPEGVSIWLGADIAWKWDTTALVPFWFRDSEYRLFGVPKILTPPRDGTSLDPDKIETALHDIHERNPIHTVVMDMSRAEQLGTWIERELGATVLDRQQTNSLAVEDYDRFMEALRSGWLKHPGDAEFTQHVLNAVARILPHGDARFDRPAEKRNSSGQELRVIDALTAAAMVNAMAATQEPEKEALVAWR